jgi:hypothetical protein
MLLAVILTTPAYAKNVYLKAGGIIQAKRVWRADGKVYVLATRHTLTSFEPSEVDMKRTFPRRHRVVKKVAAVQPQANPATVAPKGSAAQPQPKTATAAPKGAAVNQKAADEKAGITIKSLPKLPGKSSDNSAPSSGGGTIKQHKKEMAEKIGE